MPKPPSTASTAKTAYLTMTVGDDGAASFTISGLMKGSAPGDGAGVRGWWGLEGFAAGAASVSSELESVSSGWSDSEDASSP